MKKGWTAELVLIHLEQRIAAVEAFGHAEIRRLEESLEAVERAAALIGSANQIAQDKFEGSVAHRFVQVNEFRGSLDDLGKTMATRRELEAAESALQGTISELGKNLADLRSRIDIGPAGLVAVQASEATSRGRQQGVSDALTRAIAIAAILMTPLVALIVYLAHHG